MSISEKKFNYLKFFIFLLLSLILFEQITSSGFSKSISKVFSPFLYGFLIAYFLNPLIVYLEKTFNIKKVFSIFIVYTISLSIILLILTKLTPKIIISIKTLIDDLPSYLNNIVNILEEKLISNGTNLPDSIKYIANNIIDKISEISSSVVSFDNYDFTKIIDITSVVTSAITNIILGLVISIYMLKDKNIFAVQFKKLLYALFEESQARNIINLSKELSHVFSKFLVGKVIDSLIIGILCFIGLKIINAPYSLFISIIVGVTNVIPYFGPFLGIVASFIITLFYDPIKSIWTLIFVVLLQQFDGLYLGPKILGHHVGLSPFWTITTILVSGGIFGVMGMLLAVPVVSVIKVALSKFINSRLKSKNIQIK
ncbi:putative permease [Gottschalkia purinilytica]|uniref:Putative permease n=1 Tax=Gottschalkia purinilytica TaxID=1503 RepID=A0A0L0W9U1_GOTPU|nr:AI-2E family transporter [Gottschalkia purinilytica]KNF08070.1 putative permease [Gottschalkia purinilytica]